MKRKLQFHSQIQVFVIAVTKPLVLQQQEIGGVITMFVTTADLSLANGR